MQRVNQYAEAIADFGIGRGSLLQSLNVPLVHEIPGVGENLRDHFSVRMVAKVKGSVTMNELSRGGRLGAQIARWMPGRPNILALSPSLVHWFWKSNEGLNAPDLQGVFTPASYREGYIGMLDNYPGMTCGFGSIAPKAWATCMPARPIRFRIQSCSRTIWRIHAINRFSSGACAWPGAYGDAGTVKVL